MCRHQHHSCAHTLISVLGIIVYIGSPLYVELSAILPQVLESAMDMCVGGRLRRCGLCTTLLCALRLPIWFGTWEPEEGRQPFFDCSPKVHPTSGVAALGVGGQVRACCKCPSVLGAHRQQEKPSVWKLL